MSYDGDDAPNPSSSKRIWAIDVYMSTISYSESNTKLDTLYIKNESSRFLPRD